ncbi:MAG: transposase [Chloroflexota bacterium]
MRLYLSEAWTSAPERLDAAYVPKDERAFQTKWQIALDLLDTVRAEALPHHLILANAGSGVINEYRDALESRNEHSSVGLSDRRARKSSGPIPLTSPGGRGRPPRAPM